MQSYIYNLELKPIRMLIKTEIGERSLKQAQQKAKKEMLKNKNKKEVILPLLPIPRSI